jgi:S1-C subfamily serine protease
VDARLRPSILALAFITALSPIAFAGEMTTNATSPGYSAEIPDLGTSDDYVNGSHGANANATTISILGISVIDGTAQLKGGKTVRGVEICSIAAGGSGGAAGLRSEKVALSTALTAGFFAAGMFFPPALLGAMAVNGLGIGESHDLIIAVDGHRTHNVRELRETLIGAAAGELVYLVVVRGGRRNDIVIALR